MLYILEEFVEDMRFYKAGTVLKDPDGPARAFTLHIWGIRYSRMHLTDGFLPFASAHACGLVHAPQDVAEALCSRTVKLWKRLRDGYLITTYKDNNPTANRIKKLRAAARLRKQEERERKRNESQRDKGPVRRRERGATAQDSRIEVAASVHPIRSEIVASYTGDPHEMGSIREMSQRDRHVTGSVTRTQYPSSSTSTQSTQLQLLPPVVVHTTESTNLPALTRRPVDSLLKTPNAEPGDPASACAEAGGMATALRDRESADLGRADDRRLRMEGADQGPAAATGAGLPGGPGGDLPRDVGSGEGAREAVGLEAYTGAADVHRGTATEAEPAAADARRGEDGLSDGQRLLQATIDRLREQLAADAAVPDRRRHLRLAAASTERDGQASRGLESVDAVAAVETDVEGLDQRRRGVAR